MSKVVIAGDASGTGTFTISAPNGNTDRTLVLPDETGTVLTSATPGVFGNGPAFSATPATTQSITSGTYTKVNLGTEVFDTNSNFESSRFTPTVAGYYQLNGSVYPVSTGSASYVWCLIYKNGSQYSWGSSAGAASNQDGVSVSATLVYLNGSTDYVELFAFAVGTSPTIPTGVGTQFSGFLARSAT